MPDVYGLRHHSGEQLDKRSPDRGIAELAQGQHGVVARGQLRALGLATGAINLRIANGRLHRLHRGVYAVGHLMLTDEGFWMAAVLAAGSGTVLSHHAAASLWGMRRTASRVIDVTAPTQHQARPGIRFHCSRLPVDEVTTKDGIAVTTVPRTLFDLAAVLSLDQLRRAVNEAEIRRLWDPLSLHDLLKRHPRRPGAGSVRAVLATPGAGITRNDIEERFLGLLDRAGLPRPATNVPLRLGARFIEPDCMWRDERLIVELDGYGTHHTRAAYENDRARDRELTASGWRVMRVTWRQLDDEPEAVARDLRAFLAA
jgi:hypothetical protein